MINKTLIEKLASNLFILLLQGWQKTRELRSILSFSQCRFYPSCSEYSIQAIREKGILEGLFISLLRLLRCNPLFKGGFNYLSKKGEKSI